MPTYLNNSANIIVERGISFPPNQKIRTTLKMVNPNLTKTDDTPFYNPLKSSQIVTFTMAEQKDLTFTITAQEKIKIWKTTTDISIYFDSLSNTPPISLFTGQEIELSVSVQEITKLILVSSGAGTCEVLEILSTDFNTKTSLLGDINIGNVDVSSIATGENHIGLVGKDDFPVIVTPTIAGASFSINDFVGGKLTLANAVRISGGTGELNTLAIVDVSKQNVPLSIFIFGADLAGTYVSNAAESITAVDWLKWLGTIDILSSDYKSMANASVISLGGIGMKVKATTGTSLYALIVTTGTPTYTANCLQLTFGIGRN